MHISLLVYQASNTLFSHFQFPSMTLSFVSEIVSELRKLNQFLILHLVSMFNLEKISFMVGTKIQAATNQNN